MTQSSFIVLLDRTSGAFLLSQQKQDQDGKFSGGGICSYFDTDQMRTRGPDFAELLFNVTGVRTFEEPSEIEAASLGKQNQFYKTHKAVWVFRPTQDELVFWPMRPVWQDDQVISVYLDPEDASHLPWPTTSEKFFANRMAVFEISR